jgi:hypothetical protein
VHGRATVVANRIKVRNNIVYANGTHNVSQEDSFAALATDAMYFRRSNSAALQMHGAYFLDSVSEYIKARGNWGGFELYGTRNRGI